MLYSKAEWTTLLVVHIEVYKEHALKVSEGLQNRSAITEDEAPTEFMCVYEAWP